MTSARHRLIGLSLLWMVVLGEARTPDVHIIVVVNNANLISVMPRRQVAKIFLRQVSTWEGGEEILPVDQIERTPARVAFARDVQLQSLKSLKNYWEQRIFSGDDSPPPERVSDSDVLTFVRSNSGAIGYVLEGTNLGSGVKAILITDTARDATAVSAHS